MLGALVVLHVYLVVVLLAYPLNGIFPCVAEYWVMAMYFPCGVGLFQASNQRLLIISRKQIDLAKGFFPVLRRHTRVIRLLADLPGKWRGRVWRYDFWFDVGFVLQMVMSLIIFLISRKFHPFGLVSKHVDSAACRRGWEWLPTILWMVLWANVFGPLLLWNVHMVRDIYHWRLQTFIAVIASLPGTPLWLAALYSDRMAKISRYWIPPMWFVPGLIIMEVVTLVFPLLHIYKCYRQLPDYPMSAAELEGSTNASYTTLSETTTARATISSSGKLYNMKELERCLANEDDRKSLQDFACKREFTGENIMFLAQVQDFRSHWVALYNGGPYIPPAAKRRMFEVAVTIFAHLVCTDTASVYINIEGRIYKALDASLGDAARAYMSATRGSGPIVSPFGETIFDTANPKGFSASISMNPISSIHLDGVSLNSSTGASMTAETITPTSTSSRDALIAPLEPFSQLNGWSGNSVIDNFDIADGFDREIFSDAYESVKNLVYAQTWQRFNQE
ncbi:Regulator of G protein signalling superfamily [Lasallia pustulata]|uniref:Regulator of G protein signalling superfamily n=1 Tax=Lasallia pustulata TaxID=136370 RepID=A0A1W5DC19_9LECA|nr:Regulator of G protein signalling superfamily [Lasallia pustulata]